MRIAILGGTRFIGAAIAEELVTGGHEVLLIHKGTNDPPELADLAHVHCDRADADAVRAALDGHNAEALIDTCAYTAADADTTLRALPGGLRTVVLSSMDTYRAFGSLHADEVTDPLPLDEDSPVRERRYLFRGTQHPIGLDTEDYENLDVEDRYLPAGATVLRLPMVYGERDRMRREDLVLARVRAGRGQIPFGAGTFLWTRGWVRDVARAVHLAVGNDEVAGRTFNIGEARTWSIEQWARKILAAAGSDAELVRVPDDRLPEDLRITAAIRQHMLVDSSRLRQALGWRDTDPQEALEQSVAWHLANPGDERFDAAADDAALAAAL